MNKSETIGKLAEALAKVQGVIEGAKKDSENPFFRSKYADLGAVWDACREQLAVNGLSVAQTNSPSENGVTVDTTLLHNSGEWISGSLFIPVSKADAQAYGSAMTYARRYALAAMIGIYQEDDDAEGGISRDKKTKREPEQKKEEAKKLSLEQEKYFPRILAALNTLHGKDTEAKLKTIERESAIPANDKYPAKPGVKDYRLLDGKALSILCHKLEELAKKYVEICNECRKPLVNGKCKTMSCPSAVAD